VSLETFIGKGRALSIRAVAPNPSVKTLEASDPELAAALMKVSLVPSADHHQLAAAAYLRLGILDLAHEQLSAAAAIDPRDAAAWEGMARIWRDWGMPHLGLGDAYRALYYAPSAPVVHNTLGTLLQALRRGADARARFEQALRLDPTAAYAFNNLCYSWILDGRTSEAIDACERALALQPDLATVRNNLGLAYAANGDLEQAERAFASLGRRGSTEYNVGIVRLARRQYPDAVRAFEAAQTLRPGFTAAAVMARQARAYATGRDVQ
jgi:Flp pilus assembly protein TadD